MGRFNLKKWSLGSVFLLALIAALVFFVVRHAADEQDAGVLTNVKVHGSRVPASIQKVFDYSYLEGEALHKASKSRVLDSLVLKSEADGDVSVEVGNFVLLNENKQKEFACGFYDRVSVTFEAEGVAVNGEKPVLEVESPCEVGANINAMVPIKVPVQKLKNERPSQTEYKFYDGTGQPVRIQMNNPPDEWPKQWLLKNLKISHSQSSSRTLNIGKEELRQKGYPVYMNW